jgi:hypothetical protein
MQLFDERYTGPCSGCTFDSPSSATSGSDQYTRSGPKLHSWTQWTSKYSHDRPEQHRDRGWTRDYRHNWLKSNYHCHSGRAASAQRRATSHNDNPKHTSTSNASSNFDLTQQFKSAEPGLWYWRGDHSTQWQPCDCNVWIKLIHTLWFNLFLRNRWRRDDTFWRSIRLDYNLTGWLEHRHNPRGWKQRDDFACQ